MFGNSNDSQNLRITKPAQNRYTGNIHVEIVFSEITPESSRTFKKQILFQF